MPRPYAAVPFIINSISSPINVQDLDVNYSTLLGYINDSASGANNFGTDAGTANNYVVTIPGAFSSYSAGMTFSFHPANTNQISLGGCVVNVNGVGSVALFDCAGNPPGDGCIKNGAGIVCVYDGTAFRAINVKINVVDFATYATSNPFNCLGYEAIIIAGVVGTTNATIALTNLDRGCYVQILATSINPHTVKVTAADPLSNSYSVFAYYTTGGTGGGNSRINLTSPGWGGSNALLVQGTTCLINGALQLPMNAQSS